MADREITYRLIVIFVIVLLIELCFTYIEFPKNPVVLGKILIGIYWIKWILVVVILSILNLPKVKNNE